MRAEPKLAPVKLDSFSYGANIIQFFIPRLVPGDGSMITIEATIADSSNSGKEGFFTSYAAYDQGSVKITQNITQKDEAKTRIEPNWVSPLSPIAPFIILLFALVAVEIVAFSVYWLGRPSRKKPLGILSDKIIEIRSIL
jgi:hypothetical protein